MLDETPAKKPKPCSAGDTSGGDTAAALVDRLSALPDAMLHHVMSFLRAWEVASTCVLARRWRHLWASTPCVDLRVWRLGRHSVPPEDFARFVYRFLLERDESAPVDTLRLLSEPPCREPYGRRQSPSPEEGVADYNGRDVDMWSHAAIKRKARVIQFTRHPKAEDISDFEHVNMVSCHLKVLVLAECLLRDRMLRQLPFQCPSLEVLDLKDYLLEGHEISSASLKSLTIIQCRITEDEDLTIAAPNLLSLHCVTPPHRAPLFENMGSLATATVVLDDCFLHDGYEYKYKDIHHDVVDECNDSNSDCSPAEDLNYCSDSCSDASTCEYCEILTDSEDEQCGNQDQGQDHCNHCKCNDGPLWLRGRRGYGLFDDYFYQNIIRDSKIIIYHNVNLVMAEPMTHGPHSSMFLEGRGGIERLSLGSI